MEFALNLGLLDFLVCFCQDGSMRGEIGNDPAGVSIVLLCSLIFNPVELGNGVFGTPLLSPAPLVAVSE